MVRNLGSIIKLPTKKTIKEQFDLVINLSKEYSQVFWIIDLDVVLKESRECKKGSEKPIHKLYNCQKEISSTLTDKITVVINNPCLEYWFLLHYQYCNGNYNCCGSAESHLKKHLKTYEKTKDFYTKQDHDIYTTTKPKLNDAISNSGKTGGFQISNPDKSVCEMDKFFNMDIIKNYFNSEKKC